MLGSLSTPLCAPIRLQSERLQIPTVSMNQLFNLHELTENSASQLNCVHSPREDPVVYRRGTRPSGQVLRCITATTLLCLFTSTVQALGSSLSTFYLQHQLHLPCPATQGSIILCQVGHWTHSRLYLPIYRGSLDSDLSCTPCDSDVYAQVHLGYGSQLCNQIQSKCCYRGIL